MQKLCLAFVIFLSAFCSPITHAKASEQQAFTLGSSLTSCTGAEKSGNAAGTIPAFSGKWLGVPDGMQYREHAGQHHPDIYSNETPLFSISSANLKQYQKFLSAGQLAMLKKYPSYHLPVYAGHRDFRVDESICAASKINATQTKLAEDGLTISGAIAGGVPFPLPQNGLEVFYNTQFTPRNFSQLSTIDAAAVGADGQVALSQRKWSVFVRANRADMAGKPLEESVPYGMQTFAHMSIFKPLGLKGDKYLIKLPLSYTRRPLIWFYDAGSRRVRQLSDFAYDSPMPGMGDLMRVDEEGLFNGSPGRYDWQLLGKKEMLVPANAYKINGAAVKYADLLTPHHAWPALTRYELRRVWVIEAKLKAGMQHANPHRIFYVDEDSWRIVMSDYLDADGSAYQHNTAHTYYAFDTRNYEMGATFFHHLKTGEYAAYNLFQEQEKAPILNKGDVSERNFMTDAEPASGS